MVEENRSDVVGVFLKTGALMIHPEKTSLIGTVLTLSDQCSY